MDRPLCRRAVDSISRSRPSCRTFSICSVLPGPDWLRKPRRKKTTSKLVIKLSHLVMPGRLISKLCSSILGRLTVCSVLLVLAFAWGGVQAAYAGITVTPTSWNVIGLDSNNTAVGPDTFQIGARVCNTGGAAVTNVSSTFVWDSSNLLINLTSPATLSNASLAAGSCVDFYYSVTVTRSALAYNTTRSYHITVTGDSVASVSTPIPRELYVEKI